MATNTLTPEETKALLEHCGFKPIDDVGNKWRAKERDDTENEIEIGRNFNSQYPTGRFWAKKGDDFLDQSEMKELAHVKRFYSLREEWVKKKQSGEELPKWKGKVEAKQEAITKVFTSAGSGRSVSRREVEHQKITVPSTEMPSPRGGTYRVGGKEEPDAWQVRQWGNNARISTQIIKSWQDDKEAGVIVRAIAPDGQYVDATVIHRYDVLKDMMLLDLIRRYEENGINPVEGYDEEGRPILTGDALRDFFKRFIRFKVFAVRDAVSKAERVAILKILNREWREPEEIEAEMMEARSLKAPSP